MTEEITVPIHHQEYQEKSGTFYITVNATKETASFDAHDVSGRLASYDEVQIDYDVINVDFSPEGNDPLVENINENEIDELRSELHELVLKEI